MRYSVRHIMALLFGLFALSSLAAEKNPFMFYGRSFSSDGDTMPYRVLYPKGYSEKSSTKYPLVVVLHGSEVFSKEGGKPAKKIISSPVARLFQQQAVKDSFPAIVVFPQCEEDDKWTEIAISDSLHTADFPESPEQSYSNELVERLVKYYVKHYQVDEDRVYIIGMGAVGGSGALDLAVRNPKMFAAVVSICGAINTSRVKPLKKVPVRLYGSGAYFDVPITLIRDIFIELKTYGSQTAEPVIDLLYKDEQDCVKSAVNTESFLKWIFSKKR